MRRDTRRSFTVEIKSTDCRHATNIPHRVVPPAVAQPWCSPAAPSEPPVAIPEQRRILPSLIILEAAEIERELAPVVETQVKRPRGRPRKATPISCASLEDLVEAAPIQTPAVVAVPQVDENHPAAPPTPVLRSLRIKAGANLPLGERWKKRLGRWAR